MSISATTELPQVLHPGEAFVCFQGDDTDRLRRIICELKLTIPGLRHVARITSHWFIFPEADPEAAHAVRTLLEEADR